MGDIGLETGKLQEIIQTKLERWNGSGDPFHHMEKVSYTRAAVFIGESRTTRVGGELVVESLPRGSSLPGGINMCKEAIFY